MSQSPQTGFDALRLFVCGVGGLGTLTVAHLLAAASLRAGRSVVTSEVHGMSQRGGSVQTNVIVGDARSPLIADGAADLFVGLEPLEALRYREKIGFETTAVVNTERVVPVTVTMGGPEYPDVDEIENTIGARARDAFFFNATEVAEELGNPRAANVVMLGAAFGLAKMPFSEEEFFAVLEKVFPARHLSLNRRAFVRGKQTASSYRCKRAMAAGGAT